MVHFSEYSTLAANCNTETQIEMRDTFLGVIAGERVVGAPAPGWVQGKPSGTAAAGGGPGGLVSAADVLAAAV